MNRVQADDILWNAIVISLALHAAILIPAYNKYTPVKKIAKPANSIMVDYIRIKEPQPRIAKFVDMKTVETTRINLSNNNQAQIEEKTAKVEAVSETAKNEARLKSSQEYVGYYHLLRERIRDRSMKNYRDGSKEGEVSAAFRLAQDGSLLWLDIEKDKTIADPALQDAAATSIRDASPFPPFPKALTVPEMTFNIIISFKKR